MGEIADSIRLNGVPDESRLADRIEGVESEVRSLQIMERIIEQMEPIIPESSGAEMIYMPETVQRMKDKIAELEAHNRQLLNDKDASPAIIAGYREYNARLIKENKELKAKVDELDTLLSTDGGYYSGILKGRVEQREKDKAIIKGYTGPMEIQEIVRAIHEQED